MPEIDNVIFDAIAAQGSPQWEQRVAGLKEAMGVLRNVRLGFEHEPITVVRHDVQPIDRTEG